MSKITDKPDYDIIEVIGRDIELKMGKAGEYWGLAFCHEDAEPSLRVNKEKQAYFCDPCNKGGNVYTYVKKRFNLSKEEARKWLADNFPTGKDAVRQAKRKTKGTIIATFDYKDEDGQLLYQIVRYDPKSFAQRRPDSRGGWQWGIAGVRRVLYRLPELSKTTDVFIPEGEGCADILNELGLPATCNMMGAGKWEHEYNTYITGKQVFLLPDNDDTGRKDVVKKAKELLPVAASVEVIELAGLKEKGDIVDWVKERRTQDWTDEQIKAELLRLADSAIDAQDWLALQQDIPSIDAEADQCDLPFCFWRIDKNNEIVILQSYLIDVLRDRGFFYLKLPDNKGVQLVRMVDNILSEVSEMELSHFVQNNLLNELPDNIIDYKGGEVAKHTLREKVTRGIASYLEKRKLSSLPFRDIMFMRDTQGTSYHFFKNGFIEITADDVRLKDYSCLHLPIWDSQRIPFDIEVITDVKRLEVSNFAKFTEKICSRKTENGDELDKRRYKALVAVIGYLLHNFNDDTNRTAIILSDGCLDTTPQGGTGKGLLLKAIGCLRRVTTIDGKNLRKDDRFAFSELGLDTAIVHINDVKKNFDLETIFTYITDYWKYEGKGVNRISFTAETSPKTAICTNYSVRGDGASHDRRKFELELLPYFQGKTYTPKMAFCEEFFKASWTNDDWCVFYNFLFRCVQAFLNCKDGAIPDYESDTLLKKKLILEIGLSFIEFADELERDIFHVASDVYDDFLLRLSDDKRRKYNTTLFGLHLKKYCEINNLTLDKIGKWHEKDGHEPKGKVKKGYILWKKK
ncbi:MAG: hypothetical protein HQL06_10160 [Nitrospirae bacterium]|nr:hypothetical protein [Nitrospirota bacterium]